MPSYRGRLIFPFLAEIAQLDTLETDLTDPAGDADSGYDDIFREPAMDTTTEEPVRVEKPSILLPCQVETEAGDYEDLNMLLTGNSPKTLVQLVFHYQDLENTGLVDVDGNPGLRINDRLVAIYTSDTGALVQTMRVPLYATQVQSRSFGLSGLRRNLCLVSFQDRQESMA